MFPQFSGSIPDFGFLPDNQCDVQFFIGPNDGVATVPTARWVKPRGKQMAYVICQGGGGGGGGGHTAATTVARGGGGGGSSGVCNKFLIPLCFLPDELHINIGKGGPGGTATNDGTAGGNTTIALGSGLTGITSAPNVIISASGGNLGAKGTNATGGAGGTAPAAQTFGPCLSFVIQLATVGIAGTNGGAQTGAIGVAQTGGWNTVGVTGGAGGAGVNTVNTGFAGGLLSLQAALDLPDCTVTPASSFLIGGTAGGVGAAGNGFSGVQLSKPFFGTGGTGGGSSDKDLGGNGGHGALGCGGGGGGGGTTGGTGGNGGAGYCLIVSW